MSKSLTLWAAEKFEIMTDFHSFCFKKTKIRKRKENFTYFNFKKQTCLILELV